jgi:hypothetical protein
MIDERDVGVPGVGLAAAALRVQLEDALVRLDARHGRVRRGELAEPLGEPGLRRVVEVVLTAQEDHLVLQQGIPDDGYLVFRERRSRLDSDDLGTDVARDLEDVDIGHDLDLPSALAACQYFLLI